MNQQDYPYDQTGRLSAEVELMMAPTSMKINKACTTDFPMQTTTPQLSSTPVKYALMTKEPNMKSIDMPKPFRL